ncbi:MAG: phosphatase PAP2 family protein [Proteobacteria bacterium]|nr:phosphatase PAP2 family protein [Pseudomonadota bacterium]
MLESLLNLDRSLFFLINQGTRNPVFDLLMPVISEWKYFWLPLFGLLIIFGLRGSRRTRWALVALLVVFAMGDSLTTHVLKPFFDRPRPFSSLYDIHIYKGHWTTTSSYFTHKTLSFPSAHAVNVAGAAAVIIRYFPRWWPLPVVLAVLVFYSRVYLGLHYPSDVAAGLVLGLICAGVFFGIERVLVKKFPNRFTWLVREEGA